MELSALVPIKNNANDNATQRELMNTIKLNHQSRARLARWASAILLPAALGTLLLASGQVQAQPTVPGNTPTAPAGHVISVYNSSGVYTNIPVPAGYFNNWYNPGGGGAGFYDVSGGNNTNVLLYPAPIIIWGIDFSANVVNLTGCTNLHVDVWSPSATTYDIRLVNTVGASQQADATGAITPGVWHSLDIPLSVFTTANPAMSLNGIGQVGIVGDGSANSTYYIDNLYFQAGTNLVVIPPPPTPAPTNNAATPTQSATNVLSLWNSSNTYMNSPNINFYPWGSASKAGDYTNHLGRVLKSYVNMGYYGVETDPDYNGGADIDVSGFNTMHVDVWTTANQLAIKMVSTINGAAPELIYTAASGVITSNHWVSLDIPLSAFTAINGALDLTHISQLLWVDNGDIPGSGVQFGTFYFDNVYFYNQFATTVYLDPAQAWQGYMNVYDLPANGGAYEFGSPWGVAALPAVFNGTTVTAGPNVNTYNPSDAYWVNPDGSGNKICDANFYVQNDGLAGQVVTFTGYCLSNSLVSPYTSSLFIKDLNSGYGVVAITNFTPVPGHAFSISLATTAGDHIQYGLETVGPNANPATVASLGQVLVASNYVATPPPPNYPTNNAPVPTQPAANVLALWNSSNTYTDASGINFYPWGAASSVGDYTITGGAVVKSYLGLQYYGVELNPDYNGGTDINVSSYSTMHVDVWTTANQLAIKLVSTINGAAPELIYPASSGVITSNHWVSLNIPLSAFTNLVPTLDLTHLSQMLWIDNGDIPGPGVQQGNFYFDNVYFYTQSVPTAPTVTVAVNSGGSHVTFPTQAGFTYTVQYKNNLNDPTWTNLSSVSGTGSPATVVDSTTGLAHRFYRISIQ